jgi:hypothetical protein
MLEAELAAITALDNKACELTRKDHHARCTEKRAAALAAAQALGFEDCLISASLQTSLVNAWVTEALAPGAAEADTRIGMERATLLLRDVLLPTLQRRKAAGTLFAGACRSMEVAWCEAKLRHRAKIGAGLHAGHDASAVIWKSLFIGYEAYLFTAVVSLIVAAAAPTVHNLELVQFAVTAVDLMMQPRDHGNEYLVAEVTLVYQLQHKLSMFLLLDARVSLLLIDACERINGSGILRERGLDQAAMELNNEEADAESAPEPAWGGDVDELRSCALEGCGAREAHPQLFKRCGGCKAVVYCCKEHQVADWPAHKAACKAARKAAAQGGDA